MQNGQSTLTYEIVAGCFNRMGSSYSLSADGASHQNQKARLERLEQFVKMLNDGLKDKKGPIENSTVQFNLALSHIEKSLSITKTILHGDIDTIRGYMSTELELQDKIKYKFNPIYVRIKTR